MLLSDQTFKCCYKICWNSAFTSNLFSVLDVVTRCISAKTNRCLLVSWRHCLTSPLNSKKIGSIRVFKFNFQCVCLADVGVSSIGPAGLTSNKLSAKKHRKMGAAKIVTSCDVRQNLHRLRFPKLFLFEFNFLVFFFARRTFWTFETCLNFSAKSEKWRCGPIFEAPFYVRLLHDRDKKHRRWGSKWMTLTNPLDYVRNSNKVKILKNFLKRIYDTVKLPLIQFPYKIFFLASGVLKIVYDVSSQIAGINMKKFNHLF